MSRRAAVRSSRASHHHRYTPRLEDTDRMHGLDDMRERVGRLESDVAELGVKLGGAVADISSMRASQDGIGAKIDTLITSVAEIKAQYREPIDVMEILGQTLNVALKGVGLLSAVVAGIAFLISHYTTQDKIKEAAYIPPPSSAFVTIDGKRYKVTQPQ